MKKGLLKIIQPIFFGPKRGQIKEDALNIYNRNFPHFKRSSFVPSLCSTKRNKSLPRAKDEIVNQHFSTGWRLNKSLYNLWIKLIRRGIKTALEDS